jgi:hypothetical protein
VIDDGLVALWSASPTIAPLLATGDARSIFEGAVPPDNSRYPCLGYLFAGGSSEPTFNTSGVQRTRLQMDCWAQTPRDAKLLAAAVIKDFNGYSGILTDSEHIPLLDVALIHPGTDIFSGESRMFRRMLEFYLLYTFTS